MNEAQMELAKKLIEQARTFVLDPATKWAAQTPEELLQHKDIKTAVEYTATNDSMRVLVVAGETHGKDKFCHGCLMVAQENGPLTVVHLPSDFAVFAQRQALQAIARAPDSKNQES